LRLLELGRLSRRADAPDRASFVSRELGLVAGLDTRALARVEKHRERRALRACA
jgi:hypothetical protein